MIFNKFFLWLPIQTVVLFFLACSNSIDLNSLNCTDLRISECLYDYDDADVSETSLSFDEELFFGKKSLFTGIPRIVIETDDYQLIKNREIEVPARLQIWGEDEPESGVMKLTIKGRGNSTWGYPKKPYTLKLQNKFSFFGMPSAKKWVLLANFRDRTLIRNALAFEVARQTDLKWTPQGRFVDLFLNGVFQGNYYLCEKIENKKNRLNLAAGSILIEFDEHERNDISFRTIYKNFPVVVKDEKNYSLTEIDMLAKKIDSIEICLYDNNVSLNVRNYLDFKSLALYWIVYEVAGNSELTSPHSLFAFKEPNQPLQIGPVWDFDWGTFAKPYTKGLVNRKNFWLDSLKNNQEFIMIVQEEWQKNRNKFAHLTQFIDSLNQYLAISNAANYSLWPVHLSQGLIGDEQDSLDLAISKLKDVYVHRLEELDSLFFKL